MPDRLWVIRHRVEWSLRRALRNCGRCSACGGRIGFFDGGAFIAGMALCTRHEDDGGEGFGRILRSADVVRDANVRGPARAREHRRHLDTVEVPAVRLEER